MRASYITLWLNKVLLLFAIGAIFVAVSEFWFYEVTPDTSSLGILFSYGLLGYLFVLLLERYKVHSFAGFFATAALFGFLVEGIPVPVLYSGLPFTILWTSLAWHALITVLIGWYWYRVITATAKWFLVALYNLCFGLGLGLWGAYMWNAIEAPNGVDLTFVWQSPQVFMEQFLFGWFIFILGHIVFEYVAKHATRTFFFVETISLVTLAVFFYVFQLVLFFPFSLVMIMLLWTSLNALVRERDTIPQDSQTILEQFRTQTIALWRFSFAVLIPAGAWVMYTLMYTYRIEFEANALIIITAGPAALWWWGQSLWTLKRRSIAESN